MGRCAIPNWELRAAMSPSRLSRPSGSGRLGRRPGLGRRNQFMCPPRPPGAAHRVVSAMTRFQMSTLPTGSEAVHHQGWLMGSRRAPVVECEPRSKVSSFQQQRAAHVAFVARRVGCGVRRPTATGCAHPYARSRCCGRVQASQYVRKLSGFWGSRTMIAPIGEASSLTNVGGRISATSDRRQQDDPADP